MAGERVPDPNTVDRLEVRQQGERLLPPWSLRDACIWRLRGEILAWSSGCSRGNPASFDPESSRPLKDYPIQLRQEILDSMMRLKPDGREAVNAIRILLESGIKRFDLSTLNECDTGEVFEIIELLIRNGHCIEELSVTGQWLYDRGADLKVNKLLRNVPHIQRLVLQEATKEGREMENVLTFCPKLMYLEIRQPSIDDDYLNCLSDWLKKQERLPRATSNLKSLFVPSTVTGPGLLLLLRAFPNLQHLSCTHLEDMLDILDKKENREKEWWIERTAGILSVNCSLPMGPEGVTKLVSRCPRLKSVSLEVQEFTKLSSLAKLSNLRSLEIRNSATLPASYIQGVLPLLETAGAKLNHLGLEHFDVVDLMKTTVSCPELDSLTLRWFTLLGSSTSNKVKGHKPFEHLRSLVLRPRTNRHINQEACDLLLTHCQGLQRLELYCCHGLVDDSVLKLVKTNPLSAMRSLVLRHGHGLSAKGIRALIGKATRLTFWDFGIVNPSKSRV